MPLSLIAAMSANRVIGRENRIPWRLAADLKRFRKLTMGHHLIVGRRTFESIGRPLAGRTMVILTRRGGYEQDNILVAGSMEEALERCRHDPEPFVGGGEDVYRQALEHAGRIYLTLVHQEFEGDRHFPDFEGEEWVLRDREDHAGDPDNPHPYSFLLYERAGSLS